MKDSWIWGQDEQREENAAFFCIQINIRGIWKMQKFIKEQKDIPEMMRTLGSSETLGSIEKKTPQY